MIECPNCKKLIFSNTVKFKLTPLSDVKCPNCNADISISMKTLIVLVVYMLVMYIIINFVRIEIVIPLAFIGGIINLYCVYKFVPLIVVNYKTKV